MGRGIDWAVEDIVQGQKPREMRAMRPDWSFASIKTKLRQLRRGAPEESRPLKRRERDAAAESERAPSAKLGGNVALDVVASSA